MKIRFRTVERVGTTTGRWPNYLLVVDGVRLGRVKRTVSVGCDRMLGRSQPRYDAWAIRGTFCETREKAERELVKRAIRFGELRERRSL